MKLLLAICTLAACVKSDQVTVITESTADVPTDIPMRLGNNIVWAGTEDFSMYHLTQGGDRSKHCLYDSGTLTYIHHCFTKYNQKFRFGEPVPVSKVEACMNPTCTVKVDSSITQSTQKEAWTQIGTQGATDLASGLIPRSFRPVTKASSKVNTALIFRGPGFAQVFFKPICYLLEGTFDFKRTSLGQRYTDVRNTTFCVPITLPGGSLDGVYYILNTLSDN